jgi:type II secretory pathway component PulK
MTFAEREPEQQDETPGQDAEDEGPDVSELDQDPAYNPDNELKNLKGG